MFLQANHLVGLKRTYLKLSFLSVEDLTKVKREVMPAVRKNKERDKAHDAYMSLLNPPANEGGAAGGSKRMTDQLENIMDIRFSRTRKRFLFFYLLKF